MLNLVMRVHRLLQIKLLITITGMLAVGLALGACTAAPAQTDRASGLNDESGIPAATLPPTATTAASSMAASDGLSITAPSEAVTGTDAVTTTAVSTLLTNTDGTTESLTTTVTPSTTAAITASATTSNTMSSSDTFLLAYTLIDHDFVNSDGEISGHITDLVVNLQTGNVLFAEVEYGGILDIGGTELLIPLRALRWRSLEQDVILNFDEQILANYPDLTVGSPRLDDPHWYDGIAAFWNDLGFGDSAARGAGFDPTTDIIVRASDLLGYSLVDLGIGIGRVHDLLIDLDRSRALYLLVGFGPTAAGNDGYLLPFSAIDTLDVEANQITFDVNLTQATLLTAPRLDRSLFESPVGAIDPAILKGANAFWQGEGFTVIAQPDR